MDEIYRWDIINALIKKYGFISYLEIGVQGGLSLGHVNCIRKVSVDPDPESTAELKMTSDQFFKNNTECFDIIFIDGLHHDYQVFKDIENAYMCLNDGGIIVCHDCLPKSEDMQKVPRETKIWTGSGYKAFIQFRSENRDTSSFVVNTDYGIGVIMPYTTCDLDKSLGKVIKMNEITYKNYMENRNEWLNIITIQQFTDWILQ